MRVRSLSYHILQRPTISYSQKNTWFYKELFYRSYFCTVSYNLWYFVQRGQSVDICPHWETSENFITILKISTTGLAGGLLSAL